MAPVDLRGGLSAGAWLDLDLLRQRREHFGLQRPKVIPVRELLWRGGLIGSVTPLLMFLVVLFLFVQDRQLTQRQRRYPHSQWDLTHLQEMRVLACVE